MVTHELIDFVSRVLQRETTYLYIRRFSLLLLVAFFRACILRSHPCKHVFRPASNNAEPAAAAAALLRVLLLRSVKLITYVRDPEARGLCKGACRPVEHFPHFLSRGRMHGIGDATPCTGTFPSLVVTCQ